MSYETTVLIILTALGVMLAVLAIGIAVLAIMGYAGFKEIVKDAVMKHVGPAMDAKMREYPEASQMTAFMEQLKAQTALENKIGISSETGSASSASNQPSQPTAQTYPGEEPRNASNVASAAPSGPVRPDPRASNK